MKRYPLILAALVLLPAAAMAQENADTTHVRTTVFPSRTQDVKQPVPPFVVQINLKGAEGDKLASGEDVFAPEVAKQFSEFQKSCDSANSKPKRDPDPGVSVMGFASGMIAARVAYDLFHGKVLPRGLQDRELKSQQGADKFQHALLGKLCYQSARKITGSPTLGLAFTVAGAYLPEIVEDPRATGGLNDQDLWVTALGGLVEYLSENFFNGAFVTELRILNHSTSISPDAKLLQFSQGNTGIERIPSTFAIGLDINRIAGKRLLSVDRFVIAFELNAFGGGKFPIDPYFSPLR